jgi:hypothetical protein
MLSNVRAVGVHLVVAQPANQVSADRMATTLRESYVMVDDAVVY